MSGFPPVFPALLFTVLPISAAHAPSHYLPSVTPLNEQHPMLPRRWRAFRHDIICACSTADKQNGFKKKDITEVGPREGSPQ